ncbi:MAG: ParB/RepB/Spo0J family partition protein [Erysipelotrichales bacterium]|nr:ParB/RepB/Spo0J family partition protein [Erysipelotrichales bacterium]
MNQINNRKALGKGLEQLFNSEQLDFQAFEKEIVSTTPESEVKMIPIDEIRSNPYQPRIHFDEEALQELADSIKIHGVFEPIIVKKSIKGYELIAGERRTKASKLAGLDKIPAIVKDFDDQAMMEIALIENIQREDLSPIEEAKAYKNYMFKTGITQEELAKRFGKSRSYITNTLGLLNLPSSVQDDVVKGRISMSHARVLSKLADEEEILSLSKKIIDDGISVRDLENMSKEDDSLKRRHEIKVKEVSTRHKVYESTLREVLGSKVVVSKNKVTITFDSDSDLDRIMEILNIEIGE